MIQLPQESAHWYKHANGLYLPLHEVPRASGEGMRATTLTDARKLGLFPSVTTILKTIDKPDLDSYRVRQAIMSSITLPRLPGEAEDAFAKRVTIDMDRAAKDARDLGSRLHKAIEAHLTWIRDGTTPALHGADLDPFMRYFLDWSYGNLEMVFETECIVGNSALGYAGTLDLRCRLKGCGVALVDFKSQGCRNGKPVFYSEWPAQLSAYDGALDKDVDNIVSVIIDTKMPSTPHVKVWGHPSEYWHLFDSAFEWWKHINQYDPVAANNIEPMPMAVAP